MATRMARVLFRIVPRGSSRGKGWAVELKLGCQWVRCFVATIPSASEQIAVPEYAELMFVFVAAAVLVVDVDVDVVRWGRVEKVKKGSKDESLRKILGRERS